ncbi:UNVERIFIED_CONTAM: hypothetical protein Sradi_7085200 [Sesamum radiatum]|uniref:Reverse transcriptase domain-containing protein n=1 Tax=Sesamum radiatum TaxID=300843 RepID=A0AAW2J2R6_SESRA
MRSGPSSRNDLTSTDVGDMACLGNLHGAEENHTNWLSKNNATIKEVIQCLQHNLDTFAWTPQDLEGIDPKVIIHHLNIDPSVKLVKQKKRHFGLEKDKIIQAEVDKLMEIVHIEEIQFSSGYPMLSKYLNLEENGESALALETSTRHVPRISILCLESISQSILLRAVNY